MDGTGDDRFLSTFTGAAYAFQIFILIQSCVFLSLNSH